MKEQAEPRQTFAEGYRKPQVDPLTRARLARLAAQQIIEIPETVEEALQTTPDVVNL